MVNVYKEKYRTEGCGKQPSFGVTRTSTAEYCARHAPNGMVNVCRRKRRTEDCGKQPSFGVLGTKTAEYCAQHAPGGTVNVYNKKCRTEGCDKQPSFGVANTRTGEYCVLHARLQYGVEGYRVAPHHSGKETIHNIIPSGAKPSEPSGVSRDSRKQVRHPEITSMASKRAVARVSTAGAGTRPYINGQNSPVKRNSSVKTEVHLSF